ncbi:hypothetical protein ACLOJK_025314 [Asimina triloba]
MSSHAIFQYSHVTHIASPPLLPPLGPAASRVRLPGRSRRFRKHRAMTAPLASVVEADPREALERSFNSPSYLRPAPLSPLSASSLVSADAVMYAPVMKGDKLGAYGTVTLEKAKFEQPQRTKKSSPEVCPASSTEDEFRWDVERSALVWYFTTAEEARICGNVMRIIFAKFDISIDVCYGASCQDGKEGGKSLSQLYIY